MKRKTKNVSFKLMKLKMKENNDKRLNDYIEAVDYMSIKYDSN